MKMQGSGGGPASVGEPAAASESEAPPPFIADLFGAMGLGVGLGEELKAQRKVDDDPSASAGGGGGGEALFPALVYGRHCPSAASGMWKRRTANHLFHEVEEGAPLGDVVNLSGRVLYTCRAPCRGLLVSVRTQARVREQELLAVLAPLR
jgi:hypothetical protein